MNSTFGLTTLILASAFALACAGPSAAAQAPAASKPHAVSVKATDTLKFEPAVITVKSGSPVRLTLENTGVLEHDWVVDDIDGRKVALVAKPRSTAAVEFTLTSPGTYEFYCSIPGHREAGMKGSLVVQ
jgi:uncharacterized cupredoxin-like copper-binding protein